MSWITRFQIERVSRKQSLAEHSFYVALYADTICKVIGWEGDRGTLLEYAIKHDLDELITGDLPTPVKAIMKNSKEAWEGFLGYADQQFRKKLGLLLLPPEIDPEIKFIVSVADGLEAVLFLTEEEAMGNTLVGSVREYLKERLLDLVSSPPANIAPEISQLDGFIINSLLRGHQPNKLVC